jgi:hypothetical protein
MAWLAGSASRKEIKFGKKAEFLYLNPSNQELSFWHPQGGRTTLPAFRTNPE